LAALNQVLRGFPREKEKDGHWGSEADSKHEWAVWQKKEKFMTEKCRFDPQKSMGDERAPREVFGGGPLYRPRGGKRMVGTKRCLGKYN